MDFSARYNRSEIVHFLKDYFLPQDFEDKEMDVYVPESLRLIKNVTELGKSEKLNLTVFEVLHDSKDARITLTKEVFSLMKMNYIPNALVFFINEDNANYRMSLVFFDYETKDEMFELSNPRRYSFFLGEGVPTHTPDQYLIKKGRVVSEKDLKDRFSVEVLSQDFYKELADWYAWATSDNNVHFPESELDAEQNKRQQVIRLLIRLLFVWFLKQKDLIPEELFDEKFISDELLEDFAPRAKADYDLFGGVVVKSTYYKAILQNLFFATLNCPISNEAGEYQRGFRTPGQHKDVNFLMRYEDMFKNPDEFISMMNAKVPFLNGGLFDCLDDKSTVPPTYVDCFTDSDAQAKLVFPDYLFFGEDEADLTGFYAGNDKKNTSVRGIINILKTYNFTVEENTPVDIEVSLDPELLGKVFENLLADYNPETRESARKSTGSFYTPREIVQFMVDESLIAYLKDNVEDMDESKIRALLSYSENENTYTEEESREVLSAIYKCKILDPACGSGAFPMGILQQMVHLMYQLDPDNKFWQDIMLENLAKDEELARAENASFDSDEIKERKDDINRTFDESLNRPDYARKLYLIENCIHGIDIQPIAVQISKLRFFISLVIEQHKTGNPLDNFGIRPLPNLEAKIVAADSLIKIKKDEATLFASQEIKDMQELQKDYCHRLFRAKTTRTKNRYRDGIKEIRHKIAMELADNQVIGNSDASLVGSWDMFDQNSSAAFFDPEWMFGVNDGFDIIIGNPPYIHFDKNVDISSKYEKMGYETYNKRGDIYCLFYERAYELLKDRGLLCYITSNKWMRAGYGVDLRKYFINNVNPKVLVDFAGVKVFKSATVDTNILLYSKERSTHCTKCAIATDSFDCVNNLSEYIQQHYSVCGFYNSNSWVILSSIEQGIKEKIEKIGVPLKDWNIEINYGIKTGCNEAFIISEQDRINILKSCKDEEEKLRTEELIRPILRGRDIKKYGYDYNGLYVILAYNGSYKILQKEYPAIYNHLKQYEEKLKMRGQCRYTASKKVKVDGDYPGQHHWLELDNNPTREKLDDFLKPKIMYPNMTKYIPFYYDTQGFYQNDKSFMITGEHIEFLTAFLNSSLFKYCFIDNFPELQGGTRELRKIFVDKIPVIQISDEINMKFREKILAIQDSHNKEIALELDDMIFELYQLSPEERKSIGYIEIE